MLRIAEAIRPLPSGEVKNAVSAGARQGLKQKYRKQPHAKKGGARTAGLLHWYISASGRRPHPVSSRSKWRRAVFGPSRRSARPPRRPDILERPCRDLRDADTIVHANAYHMATAIENTGDAIATPTLRKMGGF